MARGYTCNVESVVLFVQELCGMAQNFDKLLIDLHFLYTKMQMRS